MRWLIRYIIFPLTLPVYAQVPELKRICPNVTSNNVVWNNPVYPCSNFHFYIVWASDKSGGPFFPVDSLTSASDNNYTHTNASPNRFYYIERRDSCGPVYNHLSDTLGIDDQPTSSTLLDSVSVDILTNEVVLGWSANPTPDFDRYICYKIDPTYITLNPAGTKDTFFRDLSGSDPGIKPLQYDINTIDSCGNPSIFQNPHTTIHLRHTFDTCAKTITLNWTHYIGWQGISNYEVYENSGSGFTLASSVLNTTTTFTKSIILGATYEYYIRAYKDTTIKLTSSSNKLSVVTRARIDPSNIEIDYVTSDNLNSGNLIFRFNSDPGAETKKYLATFTDLNKVEQIQMLLDQSDLNQEIYAPLANTSKYLVSIEAYDFCDSATIRSDSSCNIVLSKAETAHRSLSWNSYFTWNTGVEKYIIHRGTGENSSYAFSPWQETFDTIIGDSENIDNVLSNGICYYIEAIKSGSSINSKSNILCFPNPFVIYIPNAFIPTGINNMFRPEGSSIDYQASRMQIYDRWGRLVFNKAIETGWDGRDSEGEFCMDGLYTYHIEFISIKKERIIKNGLITLLR